MHETRPRSHRRSSGSTVEGRPNGQPLDDWLGDVSDDDWSENPPKRAAPPAYQELPSSEDDVWSPEGVVSREPAAVPADRRGAAAEAHRAVIERRRLVAGIVVMVVLATGVAIAVLLLRGEGQEPVAPVTGSTSTTPAPGEGRPSAASTTESSATTSPSTTQTAGGFTLPVGVKLQRDDGDPALVEELQQALSAAGFDPGPADGTFGRRTEAAVVAFQEANGLSVDGRVGPETASALNSAVADG